MLIKAVLLLQYPKDSIIGVGAVYRGGDCYLLELLFVFWVELCCGCVRESVLLLLLAPKLMLMFGNKALKPSCQSFTLNISF